MSKLTKQQKKFLKTIENPKQRFEQKIQFKLQNEFDSRIVFVDGVLKTDNKKAIKFLSRHPMANVFLKEEFEEVFGEGKTWYEENMQEFAEKFNKLAEKYAPAPTNIGIDSLTKEKLCDLEEKAVRLDLAIMQKEGIKRLEIDDIISETTNSEVPKEFCVEITKDNKNLLHGVYENKNGISKLLVVGDYLLSDRDEKYVSYNLKEHKHLILSCNKVVSTEEFLRYIGKEDLIETPKTKFSQFSPKISNDDILIVDNQTYKVKSIGEIVDKLVSLSLEKIDAEKTNNIEVINPIELSKKVSAQERNEKLYDYIEREFNVFCTNDNLQEIEDIVIDMIESDEPKPIEFDLPKK